MGQTQILLTIVSILFLGTLMVSRMSFEANLNDYQNVEAIADDFDTFSRDCLSYYRSTGEEISPTGTGQLDYVITIGGVIAGDKGFEAYKDGTSLTTFTQTGSSITKTWGGQWNNQPLISDNFFTTQQQGEKWLPTPDLKLPAGVYLGKVIGHSKMTAFTISDGQITVKTFEADGTSEELPNSGSKSFSGVEEKLGWTTFSNLNADYSLENVQDTIMSIRGISKRGLGTYICTICPSSVTLSQE